MNYAKTSLAAVAVLVSLVTFTAHSQGMPKLDVRTIDIAGVKIGMGFAATKAALTAKYPGAPMQLTTQGGLDKRYQLSKEPRSIKVQDPAGEVTVYFESRVPLDQTNPVTVTAVYYAPTDTGTPKVIAQMNEATIAKYGPPSGRWDNRLQWCGEPVIVAGIVDVCKYGQKTKLYNPPEDRDYLELSDGWLALVGNAYSLKLQSDFESGQPKTVPKF